MKHRLLCLSLSLAFLSHSASTLATPSNAAALTKIKASELSLEQLYRLPGYTGQAAQQLSFSKDGRYLAYLWNPYGEFGHDLYLYDTQTSQVKRITSFEAMQAYDAPEDLERFAKKASQKRKEENDAQAKALAQAAYLRGEKVDLTQWEKAALDEVKRELAEKKAKDAAKKANANESTGDEKKDDKKDANANKEKELWELRDELKKKRDKEKLKASDLYPGVEKIVWANQANELIFQYRGDLFRLNTSDFQISRLTQTDKPERIVSYLANDEGYLYSDERRLYTSRFDSSVIRQLNRELIHPDNAEKKYKLSQTVVSDDKQWLAITATAEEKPATPRQVEIMNYKERFASAKKVDREVSDDKRKIPAMALYIRKVAEANARQPEPVFSHDGGDVWFEMSAVSWAKDGSRYTFSTWEREKDLLRIYVGKAEEGVKPRLVFERKGNVGHEVVDVIKPQFTPDSQQLIAILDEAGYRQPYLINVDDGTIKPVLKGDFEAHRIIGFSKDSKSMFVAANKDDFAAMNIYQVELATGQMKALGQSADFHRAAAVTEQGDKVASVAGNWAQKPELKLINVTSGKAQQLTDSHDPQWASVDLIRPERFSYKNRHGDDIQAYVFKPNNWSSSQQRPAIVYVYGGPLGDRHIVESDSFHHGAYLFNMYMAAKHGYVTIAVDPRGHSNYGRKFSDANWEQPGKPQTEDLEDLAKYMQKNLGVDGKRIGLTGWSFGGFQTQYTMYTSPDTFAAGIAGAGPTEWENYNSWYSGRTIGKADRSKPNLRKFSLLPLTYGLKKPLMLVHGMMDPNVLYQDTVNVYRALLENGKESLVDLFLDPDGEHGMGGVVNHKTWYKKYEGFFLDHLGKAR